MSVSIREQYKPYSRKKEKKGGRFKEGQFLKRTYEWLRWKLVQIFWPYISSDSHHPNPTQMERIYRAFLF
jgi:hypothetical protein